MGQQRVFITLAKILMNALLVLLLLLLMVWWPWLLVVMVTFALAALLWPHLKQHSFKEMPDNHWFESYLKGPFVRLFRKIQQFEWAYLSRVTLMACLPIALALFGLYQYGTSHHQQQQISADANELLVFVNEYKNTQGALPSGLKELIKHSPLREDALLDPWGIQYQIKVHADKISFDVISAGADHHFGTKDDLKVVVKP